MVAININTEDIKKIPLFASLTTEQLDKLSGFIYLQEYDPGKIIFMEGDTSHEFYIILSGEIRIIKESADGKEKILKNLKQGDFFGEMGVIENKNRSATAITKEFSRILVMSKNTFLSYIKDNPAVAFKIILELSDRLRKANRDIEQLAFLKVEDRLKELLLRFSKKNGDSRVINIDLTHKELARMIGTSRETVTRTISRLAKKKLIKIIDSKIYLHFK